MMLFRALKDDTETTTHMHKSTAIAFLGLALAVLAGCGRESPPEATTVLERIEYLQSRAEAGDAESAYWLGSLFEFGMRSSTAEVDVNLPLAVKWYSHGAKLGNVNAQMALGHMYAEGKGVKQNPRISARWFRKAAEQGNSNGQNNLGLLYSQGEGVLRDYRRAAEWFGKAVEQGHNGAVNNLAWKMATCPLDEFRDGELAVNMMEALLVIEQPTSTTVDTLAAAYAEAGDFALAVTTQEAALSLLQLEVGSAARTPNYEKRLEAYRQRSPWREHP